MNYKATIRMSPPPAKITLDIKAGSMESAKRQLMDIIRDNNIYITTAEIREASKNAKVEYCAIGWFEAVRQSRIIRQLPRN